MKWTRVRSANGNWTYVCGNYRIRRSGTTGWVIGISGNFYDRCRTLRHAKDVAYRHAERNGVTLARVLRDAAEATS